MGDPLVFFDFQSLNVKTLTDNSQCFTYYVSMMRSFLGQKENYIKRAHVVKIKVSSTSSMLKVFDIVFNLTLKQTHHGKALCNYGHKWRHRLP